MALSNWDTLALDLTGAVSSGRHLAPSGVEVELYKNWLYVRDPHGWQADGAFQEPTVMEIQSGELRYKDVRIRAVRGPQDGIYAVVLSGWDHTLSGFVGCAVYGYEGERWIGVTPESVAWFQTALQSEPFVGTGVPMRVRTLSLASAPRVNQGDAYFAAHGVAVGPIATAPGRADEPVLTKVMGRRPPLNDDQDQGATS